MQELILNQPYIIIPSNIQSREEKLLCSFIESMFCWSKNIDEGGHWHVVLADLEGKDEKVMIDINNKFIVLNKSQMLQQIQYCNDREFTNLYTSILFIIEDFRKVVGDKIAFNRLLNSTRILINEWIPKMPKEARRKKDDNVIDIWKDKGTYKKSIIFSNNVDKTHITNLAKELKDIGIVAEVSKKQVNITGKNMNSGTRLKMYSIVREWKTVIGKNNMSEGRGAFRTDK